MERGYKYRIYPNKAQRELIAKTFGCCRFVYNHALDRRTALYERLDSSCLRAIIMFYAVPLCKIVFTVCKIVLIFVLLYI